MHAPECSTEELGTKHGAKAIDGGGEAHRLRLAPGHGGCGNAERHGIGDAIRKTVHQPEAKQQTGGAGATTGDHKAQRRNSA